MALVTSEELLRLWFWSYPSITLLSYTEQTFAMTHTGTDTNNCVCVFVFVVESVLAGGIY